MKKIKQAIRSVLAEFGITVADMYLHFEAGKLSGQIIYGNEGDFFNFKEINPKYHQRFCLYAKF